MNKLTLLICAFLFLGVLTTQAQIITTAAGDGTAGYSGDGAAATSAEIYSPEAQVFDASGNMYIADRNNDVIRKVSASGVITTIAGTGTAGYSGDGGAATSAKLNMPKGITIDNSGNIYINDEANARIRKVNTSGIITTVAGNGTQGYSGDGGTATSAEMDAPWGITVDDSGNIYIADQTNCRIRKVNTSGIISTIAGNGTAGYSGDGGAATSAELNHPAGVRVDASGNIYIADRENSVIRKINTSGIISTIAGHGVTGYAGNGGLATSADLGGPYDMLVDGLGNLYISDGGNNVIRKVNTSGIISTLAGNHTSGYSGDGAQATSAEFDNPMGIALDGSGNLYISDVNNNRIREVYLNLTVTTSVTANVTCNGASTGSVSATASNGTTPYTYSWSGGGTNSTNTGLTAGTYTITVTDNDGVTGSASVTITQPYALRDSIASYSNISYFGVNNGSAAVGIKYGTSPYTYTWTPHVSSSAIASNLSAGTYSISVTGNTGCTGTTATVIITQPAYLPYRIISPVTETVYSGGTPTTTLITCTQDSIIYRVTENTPTSDTLYIKLPDGITYSSLITASDSAATVSHISSADTLPAFQIIPAGSTFKFTILVNTPPCNALHTSNEVTKIWAKNSSDTTSMSHILSILNPELTATDVSLPNPISLAVGNVDEFVFALTDYTNSTEISKIYFNCSPDPNVSLYTHYYLTYNSGRGLAGYYTKYTYDSTHAFSYPLVHADTIDSLTIHSLTGGELVKGDTIFVHIPFLVESCNDTRGIFQFYTVCPLDSEACNIYTDTTHVNVDETLGNPVIGIGIDTFDNASFCYKIRKDSSEVKFICINNRGSWHGGTDPTPPGNGMADSLRIYLSTTTAAGHIETNTIRINGVPISAAYITTYPSYISGLTVNEIDLTHYPANPVTGLAFGNNTIQDLLGNGYADEIAERDTFYVSARFIYDTASCFPFVQCGNSAAILPSIGLKYNNECYTIPGNDSRVDTLLNLSVYYQYLSNPLTSTITTPADIIFDSEFPLTICPNYVQDWNPLGFGFDCPHSYYSMSVTLPHGYMLDTTDHSILQLVSADANSQHSNLYEYLPVYTATGPCSHRTDTLSHPLLQEFYSLGDTTLVVNFGRVDSDDCGGDYSRAYLLSCINIPLIFDCNPAEHVAFVDTVSFTLQYTCDSACSNCSNILACGNTTTYNHPCGSSQNIPYTRNSDLTIFRTNLGYINQKLPKYYTTSCSTLDSALVPSLADALIDSTAVNDDAGYPGDQVETIVNGGYDSLTPNEFVNEYLQIRHAVFPGSPHKGYLFELDPTVKSYFIINGCTGVSGLNGDTLVIPLDRPFYTDTATADSVYMNFSIDSAMKNSAPALYSTFITDAIHEYISVYAQLHLRVWNPDLSPTHPSILSVGENTINLRNEYMAVVKPGGYSADSLHSSDSWGTRFTIIQPNIPTAGIGANPNVSVCAPFNMVFAITVPFFNGADDFPNEFRPYFKLDSNLTITIPPGYMYKKDTIYTYIDNYDTNRSNNYFRGGASPQPFSIRPTSNSNPLGNPASPTKLKYVGLNNSCWPLVDQKYWGSNNYQGYYLTLTSLAVCNVPSPSTFYDSAGYRIYTQQRDTDFQIHFLSHLDSAVVTHVNPVVNIGTPPLVTDYSNLISFEFTLCTSGSNAISNGWVAFENPAPDTLNLTTATLTNVITHQTYYPNLYNSNNGVFFNVGAIGISDCETLLFSAYIDSNSHSCPAPKDSGNGTVLVRYGNTCNDTLKNPDSTACENNAVDFHYKIYANDLTLTNNGFSPSSVSLCGGLLVDSLTITSADLGTISNPEFWIDSSAGYTVDSVVFRYPCGGAKDTNIHTPDAVVIPSGGGIASLGWNLNKDLKIHGLRGLLGPTPLNDSNTVCVKVYMTMNCNYTNHQPIVFYTSGISTCSILDTAAASISPTVSSACCNPPKCWSSNHYDTVLINPDAKRLLTLALYRSNGGFYLDTVLIEGVFTVDTDFGMSNSEVSMAPNALINVVDSSTLGIGYISWVHAASTCDTMWRGIFVHPGSFLFVQDAPLIEDADTAVYAMNSGHVQGTFLISNSTFNKNWKNLVVQPCEDEITSTVGGLFTCQSLDTLYHVYPGWVDLPEYTWEHRPFATLLYPHIGEKTYMGWEFDSVKGYNQRAGYGAGIFNNMSYGIYAMNTNLVLQADSFMNIIDTSNKMAAVTSFGGTVGDTLIVGEPPLIIPPYLFPNGCGFVNCTTGVFADAKFSIVNVSYNYFYDSLATPTIGVLTNGDMQFLSSIIIDSNTIHGATVGVQCILNRFTRLTQIDSNVITGRSACDSATGIYISEIGSRSAFYNVYNNTINYLHYGIYVNDVRADTIYKNSILLTGDTGCVNPVAKGIAIIGGYNAQVVDNTVSMNNYTSVSDFTGTDFTGIYVENSPSAHITCNTTNYLDTAIDCSGAGDVSCNVLNNTMNAGSNSAAVGIYLPNGSLIGQQGIASSASDNVWNGTFNCNSYVPPPTFISFSPFFIQSGSIYNADLGSCSPYIISTFTATASSENCGTVTPIHLDLLDTIARREITYAEYADTTNIIAKSALTSVLWDNTSLLLDTILSDFNDSISTTSLGDIMRADSAMVNTTSSLAGTAYPGYFSSLTPASNIEAHLQTIGKIILNARSTGATSLTSTELSALETLANKCPYTDGIGVYQARTLLDYYTGKVTLYNDEGCTARPTHKPVKHNENIEKSDTLNNVSANIYPNPNNGNFTLAYNLGNQTSGRMELYNQVGMKIAEYFLTSPIGSKEISAPNISNGLYIYKLYADNEVIKVGKIIIIK